MNKGVNIPCDNSESTKAPSGISPAEIKAQIRSNTLAKRKAISAEDRCMRSQQACEDLVLRYRDVLVPGAMVAGYAALGSEMDPHLVLQMALQNQGSVCLPCMVQESQCGANYDAAGQQQLSNKQNMVFFEVDGQTLEQHKLPFIEKPAEPLNCDDPLLASLRLVTPDEIDLIVVPLVAFDAQNYRLGYGGGNYDRYLVQLDPKTPKVGIAFYEQQVASLPIEAHDVQLSYIEIA